MLNLVEIRQDKDKIKDEDNDIKITFLKSLSLKVTENNCVKFRLPKTFKNITVVNFIKRMPINKKIQKL